MAILPGVPISRALVKIRNSRIKISRGLHYSVDWRVSPHALLRLGCTRRAGRLTAGNTNVMVASILHDPNGRVGSSSTWPPRQHSASKAQRERPHKLPLTWHAYRYIPGTRHLQPDVAIWLLCQALCHAAAIHNAHHHTNNRRTFYHNRASNHRITTVRATTHGYTSCNSRYEER